MVQVSSFRFQVSGFRVQGSKVKVEGARYDVVRVSLRDEGRAFSLSSSLYLSPQ